MGFERAHTESNASSAWLGQREDVCFSLFLFGFSSQRYPNGSPQLTKVVENRHTISLGLLTKLVSSVDSGLLYYNASLKKQEQSLILTRLPYSFLFAPPFPPHTLNLINLVLHRLIQIPCAHLSRITLLGKTLLADHYLLFHYF